MNGYVIAIAAVIAVASSAFGTPLQENQPYARSNDAGITGRATTASSTASSTEAPDVRQERGGPRVTVWYVPQFRWAPPKSESPNRVIRYGSAARRAGDEEQGRIRSSLSTGWNRTYETTVRPLKGRSLLRDEG